MAMPATYKHSMADCCSTGRRMEYTQNSEATCDSRGDSRSSHARSHRTPRSTQVVPLATQPWNRSTGTCVTSSDSTYPVTGAPIITTGQAPSSDGRYSSPSPEHSREVPPSSPDDSRSDLDTRNTAYYQNQLDKSMAPRPASESKVLVMSPHCPAQLMKQHWNIDQFSLKKVLYVGNISRVLQAVDKISNTAVALKVYKRANLSDMEKYQVAREIRMHSELHHENIISLYCAWKDSHYVYMAVEWAPAGDLYKLLSTSPGLDEAVIVEKLLKPLLSALSFIHSRGLIHRDLKPENILLDSEFNIKLSDFGLSINLNHEVANTRLGTLDYIAPEILDCPYKHHPLQNKDNLSLGYDNKVDVWSTGVLAYELIVGHTPFRANSLPETLSKIKQNNVIFPPGAPQLAKDFISTCLQSDPARRPTINQLCRHPWMMSQFHKRSSSHSRSSSYMY